MAGEDQQQPVERAEPAACSACRGTGQVISKLGGNQASVQCPWCDGGGFRIPGHDAQAARRAAAAVPHSS